MDEDQDVEMLEDYEIVNIMNKNSEREILLCKKNENLYVIKSYKKITGYLLREIDIIRKFQHPNILSLEDIFIYNNRINIVTKAYDSDCYKLLLYKTLPISQRIMIIKKVANGLKFLHDNGVIHMDLKPSNIFICENDKSIEVVIGDFSVSNFFNGKENNIYIQDNNPLTYAYSAPENLLSLGGKYNYKTDIWSFSMFCLEILTDQFLIGDGKLGQREVLSILRERTFFDKDENISFMCKNIDKRFKKKCKNFLYYIIQYEQQDRPHINEIINNELFKGLEYEDGTLSKSSIIHEKIDWENYIFVFQTTFLILPHIKVEAYFLSLNIFKRLTEIYKNENYKFFHQLSYISIKIALDVLGINDLAITEIDENIYHKILIKLEGDFSSNCLYEKCVSLEDLIQVYSDIENGEYGKEIINIFGRSKNVTFDIFYINYENSR